MKSITIGMINEANDENFIDSDDLCLFLNIESILNLTANTETVRLKVKVGSTIFRATLHNNATVTAFKAQLPMTIKMTELNGNEKYGELSGNIPSDASNPGTIQIGDLMLYGSNTLVLFYKTFSTSYSYTKIGRIDDPSGLATALGGEDVTLKLELE